MRWSSRELQELCLIKTISLSALEQRLLRVFGQTDLLILYLEISLETFPVNTGTPRKVSSETVVIGASLKVDF